MCTPFSGAQFQVKTMCIVRSLWCVVQRLCEELEYSELLDRVVEINDPFERMVLYLHSIFLLICEN